MKKVVPFKKPAVIRCAICGRIKPLATEGFSHRGIDYPGGTQAKYWMVFSSGWKATEIVPVKVPADQGGSIRKRSYQCPDCAAR